MKFILAAAVSSLLFLDLSCTSKEAEAIVDVGVIVDSSITEKDSVKLNTNIVKPVSDSVVVISDTAERRDQTCDIQLLNAYEKGSQHKVYIFYIHGFGKESKECWWGMLEHVTNHDVMDQAKYKCTTKYILDMDNKYAEKYADVTEEEINKDLSLKKMTIARLVYCAYEKDEYEADPFKLHIYKDPIPYGWSPGDK